MVIRYYGCVYLSKVNFVALKLIQWCSSLRFCVTAVTINLLSKKVTYHNKLHKAKNVAICWIVNKSTVAHTDDFCGPASLICIDEKCICSPTWRLGDESTNNTPSCPLCFSPPWFELHLVVVSFPLFSLTRALAVCCGVPSSIYCGKRRAMYTS